MVTRTPGRGKRLIKPFCPFATTATTEACIFLWKYQKICFVFENILLWLHGCGSQNSGIPTELPWLTFASSHRQICPLLRISFSPHTFQPFWAEFVRISRTLILPARQSFPYGGASKNVAQWWLHPNISASTSMPQKPLAIHCNGGRWYQQNRWNCYWKHINQIVSVQNTFKLPHSLWIDRGDVDFTSPTQCKWAKTTTNGKLSQFSFSFSTRRNLITLQTKKEEEKLCEYEFADSDEDSIVSSCPDRQDMFHQDAGRQGVAAQEHKLEETTCHTIRVYNVDMRMYTMALQ